MKSALFIYILTELAFSKNICKIQEKFQLQTLYRKGDVMLGGIFELTIKLFYWAHTMIFAIEEINQDPVLLPNITLGYRLYDNCLKLQVALRAAMSLIGGLNDSIPDSDCRGLPPVIGIVGDPLSSHSIAISRVLGLFRMPLISYYASCSCLSNKIEYPSFFRTVPSDAFQVKAMVQIIKHFGWTWVGIIGTDDDYGQYAMNSFHEEIKPFGCIAFTETFPKAQEKFKYLQIINTIKHSTAKVIVVFSPTANLIALSTEIIQHNLTGRQWVASEAWSTSNTVATNENIPFFGGTIGIAIRRGEIPGLDNFLFQIRPSSDPNNNLILRFWETMFECKFQEAVNNQNDTALPVTTMCTGYEDIKSTRTAYTDVSESRASYNVYKAVYALAIALHELMFCENGKGPFENNSCADIKSLQPWQLMHYIRKVNFTNRFGERVAFDENGDALAIYDIVNWQKAGDGSVTIKTIGVYDKAASGGQELFLNEKDIFWNFASGQIPESVCSKSCQPGTRKANRKGEVVCCFDCVPCADGEISSKTDSITCTQCPPDYWSNQQRNQCISKEIEFLSYEDAMGITLATTAVFGSCMSISVLLIFLNFRNTPVVKANNSELSFLLLLSLTFCFLCSLCFIGEPSNATCMLRHVVFGISFVLSISCILVKTIVVIMAFKATLPGNNMMKWFGVTQQRGTVFMFSFIQSLVCVVWLSSAPPFPSKNTKHQNSKVIFECDIGSLIGFSCLLGYIGLLACISFVLAFLARNLPDTFNEAKFITFSMLIFCAVWITFIPAYISSPGKYTVAVEIFAILASSFGLLSAIFAPKCYIILLKPERNTKRALMGR
uniref:Extracellular calcium-sensing receptor-like n=1 Tax=Erpetoichthys calabaricus TaxID=27687 RepID=A0A8C4SG96_ERPCA